MENWKIMHAFSDENCSSVKMKKQYIYTKVLKRAAT